MKTYEERKKETCEWCAKGGGYAHDRRHLDYDGYLSSQSKPCTALSREDYEAELRAEIAKEVALSEMLNEQIRDLQMDQWKIAEAIGIFHPMETNRDEIVIKINALRAAFSAVATVIQGAYLNGQLPPISDAELAEKIITEYGRKQASSYEQGKRADVMEDKLRDIDDLLASREMAAKGGTDYVVAIIDLVGRETSQVAAYLEEKMRTARDIIENDGTHAGGCAYIETLMSSLVGSRPRSKVKECNCWISRAVAALADTAPTDPDALTGCADDAIPRSNVDTRVVLEVSRDKLLEAQRYTGLNYSDLIARIDMVLADASPHKDFIAGLRAGKTMAGWFEGGTAEQVRAEIDVQIYCAESNGVADGMPICGKPSDASPQPESEAKHESAADQIDILAELRKALAQRASADATPQAKKENKL